MKKCAGRPLLWPFPLMLVALAAGCSVMPEAVDCRVDPTCEVPADAVDDHDVGLVYASRAWLPQSKLEIDTVELGKQAEIPVNDSLAKLIGPGQDDAVRSLAAKIWMIEHAEHSIDLAYYIFTRDLAGYAVLGALCNAVKRGVDVRLMVDSIGSYSIGHPALKGLLTCADEAGFMRTEDGRPTPYRARVQVVIFNALSKIFVSFNRRSHDKLIVKDGHVPSKAYVMTGGRNISNDYYGITEEGNPDPSAYKDIEILLRPDTTSEDIRESVGSVSEIYYTLLFMHKGNRPLWLVDDREEKGILSDFDSYVDEQNRALQNLRKLHGFPLFAKAYEQMDSFMTSGFHKARVRLAHELENLSASDVVTQRERNLRANPNSIVGLLTGVEDKEWGSQVKVLKVVSPYFFIPRYYDEEGNVTVDGAVNMRKWLEADPERRIELVTNSVMTSDNFMAQAMIDIDTVPRMLLSPELQEAWGKKLEKGELNPEVVGSEEWRRQIDNPRVRVYQTGKLDATMFGGDKHYGKLHAKFILSNVIGFVGTANFDYRSRLYNNEMGFFFQSEGLSRELDKLFQGLKGDSYLWGSPEWLEMRARLRELDTSKGHWANKQHSVFTRLRRWGLKWQI